MYRSASRRCGLAPPLTERWVAKKAAACFARRVKRAAQKYKPFRNTEIMK
jgi:hypothetical protein